MNEEKKLEAAVKKGTSAGLVQCCCWCIGAIIFLIIIVPLLTQLVN